MSSSSSSSDNDNDYASTGGEPFVSTTSTAIPMSTYHHQYHESEQYEMNAPNPDPDPGQSDDDGRDDDEDILAQALQLTELPGNMSQDEDSLDGQGQDLNPNPDDGTTEQQELLLSRDTVNENDAGMVMMGHHQHPYPTTTTSAEVSVGGPQTQMYYPGYPINYQGQAVSLVQHHLTGEMTLEHFPIDSEEESDNTIHHDGSSEVGGGTTTMEQLPYYIFTHPTNTTDPSSTDHASSRGDHSAFLTSNANIISTSQHESDLSPTNDHSSVSLSHVGTSSEQFSGAGAQHLAFNNYYQEQEHVPDPAYEVEIGLPNVPLVSGQMGVPGTYYGSSTQIRIQKPNKERSILEIESENVAMALIKKRQQQLIERQLPRQGPPRPPQPRSIPRILQRGLSAQQKALAESSANVSRENPNSKPEAETESQGQVSLRSRLNATGIHDNKPESPVPVTNPPMQVLQPQPAAVPSRPEVIIDLAKWNLPGSTMAHQNNSNSVPLTLAYDPYSGDSFKKLLRRYNQEDIVAVTVESVQGEGGLVLNSSAFSANDSGQKACLEKGEDTLIERCNVDESHDVTDENSGVPGSRISGDSDGQQCSILNQQLHNQNPSTNLSLHDSNFEKSIPRAVDGFSNAQEDPNVVQHVGQTTKEAKTMSVESGSRENELASEHKSDNNDGMEPEPVLNYLQVQVTIDSQGVQDPDSLTRPISESRSQASIDGEINPSLNGSASTQSSSKNSSSCTEPVDIPLADREKSFVSNQSQIKNDLGKTSMMPDAKMVQLDKENDNSFSDVQTESQSSELSKEPKSKHRKGIPQDSILIWKHGRATLPGTNLVFKFDEHGLLAVASDDLTPELDNLTQQPSKTEAKSSELEGNDVAVLGHCRNCGAPFVTKRPASFCSRDCARIFCGVRYGMALRSREQDKNSNDLATDKVNDERNGKSFSRPLPQVLPNSGMEIQIISPSNPRPTTPLPLQEISVEKIPKSVNSKRKSKKVSFSLPTSTSEVTITEVKAPEATNFKVELDTSDSSSNPATRNTPSKRKKSVIANSKKQQISSGNGKAQDVAITETETHEYNEGGGPSSFHTSTTLEIPLCEEKTVPENANASEGSLEGDGDSPSLLKKRKVAELRTPKPRKDKEEKVREKARKSIATPSSKSSTEESSDDSPNKLESEQIVFPTTRRASDQLGLPRGTSFDFDWTKYLESTKAKAAPVHLFRKKIIPDHNHFNVGDYMEAIDPQNQSLFCVVHVVEILGSRLKLRFLGYGQEYDFWVPSYSENIFPPGWASENGFALQPPKGHENFSWNEFMLNSNVTTPKRESFSIYEEPLVPPANVKLGMKLEATDLRNLNNIRKRELCVASVGCIMGHRLLIHFDSWSSVYDVWVDLGSPFIRPVGFAEKNSHTLIPPNNFKNDFSWEDYLRLTKSEPLGADLFKPPPALGWKAGMKLECVDKRNESLIRVATVAEVKNYQILIHMDGWPSSYDYPVSEISESLFPAGYCKATGHPLQPPPPDGSSRWLPHPHGCCGFGHIRGFPTHDSERECPYGSLNFKKDFTRDNRVIVFESPLVFGETTCVPKVKTERKPGCKPKPKKEVDPDDTSTKKPKVVPKRDSKGHFIKSEHEHAEDSMSIKEESVELESLQESTSSTTSLINSSPIKEEAKVESLETTNQLLPDDQLLNKSEEAVKEHETVQAQSETNKQIEPFLLFKEDFDEGDVDGMMIEDENETLLSNSKEIGGVHRVGVGPGGHRSTSSTTTSPNIVNDSLTTTVKSEEPMEKSQYDPSTSFKQKIDPVIEKPKNMSIVEPPKEIVKPKPSMEPVFAVKSKPPNLARSIILPKMAMTTTPSQTLVPVTPVTVPIITKTSERLAKRRANSSLTLSSTVSDSPSSASDSKRSRASEPIPLSKGFSERKKDGTEPKRYVMSELTDAIVGRWDKIELARFIAQIPGCKAVANRFEEQMIDGESFLLLTSKDLQTSLGLQSEHVVKFRRAIDQIHKNSSRLRKPDKQ